MTYFFSTWIRGFPYIGHPQKRDCVPDWRSGPSRGATLAVPSTSGHLLHAQWHHRLPEIPLSDSKVCFTLSVICCLLILSILILLCAKIPGCIASMSSKTAMDHFSIVCQSVHQSVHPCHLNVLTGFCSWHVFLRTLLFNWFPPSDCLYVEPLFMQYLKAF